MRGMRVSNGDLEIGPGRRVEMVEGRDKLVQALTLWLLEPLGTGPTTPGFGSLLPEMIGSESAEEQALEVENEVGRILGLYQGSMIERLKEARDNGRLALWSRGEVLNEIGSIQAVALPGEGRVLVKASISTASDDVVNLPIEVDDDGVSI